MFRIVVSDNIKWVIHLHKLYGSFINYTFNGFVYKLYVT